MNEEYLIAAKRNRERLEKSHLKSKKKTVVCDYVHKQKKVEVDKVEVNKEKVEYYHPSMYVGFGAKPASTYRNGKPSIDNALAVTSNQTR